MINPNTDTAKRKSSLIDLLIVLGITLITFLIAFIFDLSERYYQWTRIWEKYQVDELFFPLISFSLTLIWFSWRRAVEAKKESIENSELLAENRRLIQKITETQEHERVYLAQELHDVFAQYLTVLRTHAEHIQTLSSADNTPLLNSAQNIIENVNKLHVSTRALLKNLRPALLDFGVVMAIEDLVTEWQLMHNTITCNLEFEGSEPELNQQEILVLYRTIQEGLTNIAKHSNAEHVDIKLRFPETSNDEAAILSLQIIDDGSNKFDPDTTPSGLGLIGIRERACLLNGHFTITPLLTSGTKLEFSFPLCHTSETS